MKKYYHFAGMDFCIEVSEENKYLEDGKLASFVVESVENPHYFKLELVEALESPEGECVAIEPNFRVYSDGKKNVRYIGATQQKWENAYIRASHMNKVHEAQFIKRQYPKGINARAILNVLAAEHLIARNHGVILHASYIAWRDRAILFTAPSGTGKSTQAELWKDLRGAQIINGDRVAIRLEQGKLLAEGIPFAGSSKYCENRSLPLAAVVYLGQAPTTTIRRMKGAEAFMRIWEGCSVNTWDREDVRLISDLVTNLVQTVPIYHLTCTPDESAVVALEHELRK